MMYTIKQLKKMSTERLHKVFQNIKGYMLFNPYQERDFMVAALANETVQKTQDVIAVVTPDWNEETQSVGMRVFHPLIEKLFAAINENHLPKRVETKGRKSRFSYRDVWDMLHADIQGMKLSEIAQYFETSSVVVYQILTGVSYQWASGITQESFI